MTVNQYFNKFSATNEQDLYENMIIEAIQIKGIEVEYLPRTLGAPDELFNSDSYSLYNSHYPIEMYIKSVNGFEGDGTFLSKFGIEIRDQVTLSVAMRRFDEEITANNGQARPNEGDLIYFPLGDRIFYIKTVNHRPQFYVLGHLNLYDLVCESFEYASERFNTGIEFVDNLENSRSNDVVLTGNTNFDIPWDAWAENTEIQTEANTIIDFSEKNPFGDLD